MNQGYIYQTYSNEGEHQREKILIASQNGKIMEECSHGLRANEVGKLQAES